MHLQGNLSSGNRVPRFSRLSSSAARYCKLYQQRRVFSGVCLKLVITGYLIPVELPRRLEDDLAFGAVETDWIESSSAILPPIVVVSHPHASGDRDEHAITVPENDFGDGNLTFPGKDRLLTAFFGECLLFIQEGPIFLGDFSSTRSGDPKCHILIRTGYRRTTKNQHRESSFTRMNAAIPLLVISLPVWPCREPHRL